MSCAAVYARSNAELSARVQLSNQSRARAEVQIAVGESAAGGGVHVDGNINLILILDRSGSLDLEHGVDRVCALLGNKQLTADILLIRRCGGVVHRRGDGILLDLDLGNVGRNHQLQFTGIIRALRRQVTLQNAHRNAGSGCTQGQGEVIALGLFAILTLSHLDLAAGIHQVHQFRPSTEIQIAVGKCATGCFIYLNGDINQIFILDCSGSLNLEHWVDLVCSLLGNKQLTADVLLIRRCGGVLHHIKGRGHGSLSSIIRV